MKLSTLNNFLIFKAKTLTEILNDIVDGDRTNFDVCSRIVTKALKNDNTIFYCGNGGSAVERSHLAASIQANSLLEFVPTIRMIPQILGTGVKILNEEELIARKNTDYCRPLKLR